MFRQEAREKLVFEVKDTGVGISDEDQAKLFKMFGTLQNTRQMNNHGVGLGLFICKQLVEQFSGEIAVRSKLGEGTSFFFSVIVQEPVITNRELPTSSLAPPGVADFDIVLETTARC